MSDYIDFFENKTGKKAPKDAEKLDVLFDAISSDKVLPPRGQQAVNLGFTAHTLNDPSENPMIYNYYQWILKNFFKGKSTNELSSQLIGMSFVSANIFETNLPQPITLNPWQIEKMHGFKLMNQKAVVIENNGVFIWLHKLHPKWPLINQTGNDFNESYNELLKNLVDEQGLKLTYLGDLDSDGIRIADHLSTLLNTELFSIQTPTRIFNWLIRFGKIDKKRTRKIYVQNEVLSQEMESINTLGKFVEQEQLIAEYEILIDQWLKK